MTLFTTRSLVAISAILAFGCNKGVEESAKGETTNAKPIPSEAPGERATKGGCDQVPSTDTLKRLLASAPKKGEAGGLASGRAEWAAVVNRDGELCAVAVATEDPSAAWPGSQAIAKSKAYTANAFSTDEVPLSTARLYTLSQPGHSLWGIAAGNPINPECVLPPTSKKVEHRVCGGTIAFGGGVPLYKGNTRVGGLGVSGDTACADHEIAKRMRDEAGLNPAKGQYADDIQYASADGPSIYTHPLCPNTWRNGKKIGEEPPASGY
ncbi:MAG TPA: heme-binding protein [Polyangiaceae bacterium]|jgi:uncharacterized protein GlcG (DUF336 family)|nr:heme-binding protein [Polyangiaceae bacterium]